MNKEKQAKSLAGTCASARDNVSLSQSVLNVLIACEESQAECLAFRELGHNAFSCDIQKCNRRGNPDWHILGDVTPYLEGKTSFTTQSGKNCTVEHWDLIIAHPPCTYLCKTGSVWLYKNKDGWRTLNGEWKYVNTERYRKMCLARLFFLKCLNAKADYVAVENPLPMRAANLPKATTFVCPSWFGCKYTKKTLYWLKNLPPIMATYIYDNPKCLVTSSRGKYRSRTYVGLAKAIAEQWSNYILQDISK